jgi:hypothetical protein
MDHVIQASPKPVITSFKLCSVAGVIELVSDGTKSQSPGPVLLINPP